METVYSAIIIAASVFVLILCICVPTMRMSQEKETRLEGIRNSGAAGTPKLNRRRERLERIVRDIRERDSVRAVVRRNTAESQGKDTALIRALAAANIDVSEKVFGLIRIAAGLVLGACLFLLTARFEALKLVQRLAAGMLGLMLGMTLPKLLVKRKAKKRKTVLLNSMPDSMDLLAISTSAGLGFDAAVMRIAEDDNSPCIQELKIVMSDVQHGVSKKTAYLAMERRCDIKEMTAFVNAVLQADELGVSLSDVLREQAGLLRENRRIRAEEAANKAPVKMTIPLVTCIFPAIFIVLLGPAVITIMEYV